MKKFWRLTVMGILAALILGVASFWVWAANPAMPEQKALDELHSTELVRFEDRNGWLVFTPALKEPEMGLIFYPGGRVDYRAYTPHIKAIAEAGFLVVVVPMPLNFAFLGVNRAADVIQTFPEIDHWVVGGHSLGGAMAAEFAKSNLALVDGIVFWASYPAESTDLTEANLNILSIYASNDGLATPQEIEESRSRLPDHSTFIEIIGGNHAGFGWYGPQNGDGTMQIARSDQLMQVVTATIEFLTMLQDK